MLRKLILIALAGAIGTLARYGVSGMVQRVSGGMFPWGTLAVNLTGCFLAGALWSATVHRIGINPDLRAAVFVGFMGAYTTYSTFTLETGHLLRDGAWFPAVGNILLHQGVGLIALFIGQVAGEWV